MDRETAKLLLQSYRPQDAHDPIFREALREVAANPDLAAWFEETQRFDAAMAAKFQDVPVPPEVKTQILRGYREAKIPVGRPRDSSWGWMMAGSIAALFLAGLFVWYLTARLGNSMSPLEAEAISYTDKMPALQFVCFNASAVAHWINDQPGSQKVNLKLPEPDKSMAMAMIGSSVLDWQGRPVVMVCLQNGKRMAMLYIMNASDAPGMKEGVTETVQKAGWVVRATKSDGQLRLLAARGGPDDLNFPMPSLDNLEHSPHFPGGGNK